MAPQATVVPSVRWYALLLAFVPLLAFIAVGYAVFGQDDGLIVAIVAYAGYRFFIVRRIVCRDHRNGIVLTRHGQFADAIAAFQRSEASWERHPTLDRYRALVLGSPTSHSFRLFAKYNQAYCLSRLGRGAEARDLVDRVLAEAPDMLPARELRDVLNAGSATAPS